MNPDRSKGTSAAQAAETVAIPIGRAQIFGDLVVPAKPIGLVMFAHGSGSSRHSPRNTYVARLLQGRGLATLLYDLLTAKEEGEDQYTGSYRFDIPLLGKRTVQVIDFLKETAKVRHMALGLFGASTGAAAALVAAAERPDDVRAVVSRGGRPDLASNELTRVKAPTLLIVGGYDTTVIGMNRQAMSLLPAEKELVIVPGASHLFEEPGTLEEVARLAGEWFEKYLTRPS